MTDNIRFSPLNSTCKDFFWLGTPWLTILATTVYLILVLKVGPSFMRDRKPYDLKLAIRIYNLLLVAINSYLFFGTLLSFNYGRDFWGCGEALSTRKRDLVLHYGHLFFHTRYLEFFDTFFFVLRKKYQQISFLHVFHHAIVPILMYTGLKFYPLPFNSILGMTNMFVHIIMYAYYGLATFGPAMQPYLWWKRYLTTMQISQFAILLAHSIQPILFYNRQECNFPLKMVFVNFCIGMTFLSLFVSFYRKSYGETNKGRGLDGSGEANRSNGLKQEVFKKTATEFWSTKSKQAYGQLKAKQH